MRDHQGSSSISPSPACADHSSHLWTPSVSAAHPSPLPLAGEAARSAGEGGDGSLERVVAERDCTSLTASLREAASPASGRGDGSLRERRSQDVINAERKR